MPFCPDDRAAAVGVEVPPKHLKVLKCHIFTALNQIETALHVLPPGASIKNRHLCHHSDTLLPSVVSQDSHAGGLPHIDHLPQACSSLMLPLRLSLQPPDAFCSESTACVVINISPWTQICKQILFSKTSRKGRQNC